MDVTILEETVPWEFRLPNGHVLFRIVQARLTHDRFGGGQTPALTRINFERGDAVCVLPYAEETDEVVLVEQFRYPAFASFPEAQREGKGWLIEVVAGMKDADGHVVAERELLEETGCELTSPLEHLTTFYVSPGGTSEKVEVYLERVRKIDGLKPVAGCEHEGEDIKPHVVRLSEALKMVRDGRIEDAKTMIALMMLKEKLER